ncbi:hypothetical protein ACRALDRAFT_1064801 [Sodiomyces alcalophilus JCM 7366]|uniref:uncharacterized protein n=1 Tax=Sodiomyces alcalophilus JCM 7366 TaxID=591952 RepID=UPI0039B678D2
MGERAKARTGGIMIFEPGEEAVKVRCHDVESTAYGVSDIRADGIPGESRIG